MRTNVNSDITSSLHALQTPFAPHFLTADVTVAVSNEITRPLWFGLDEAIVVSVVNFDRCPPVCPPLRLEIQGSSSQLPFRRQFPVSESWARSGG